jgi:hypothetical protein
MFVMAVHIASALIPTNTLMAQKVVAPPMAQETITSVTTKDPAVFPGEQALMYTVDSLPGYSSPIHRHNASSYVTGVKLIPDSGSAQHDATCSKV